MKTSHTDGWSLRFLYRTIPGRAVLQVLNRPWLSRLCGRFLDSPLSKPLISGFVRKNEIDLTQFESDSFSCFNDCFSRKIKDGLRPVLSGDEYLCAPCDGLLSAYSITRDTVLPVKQSRYSIPQLLQDEELAKRYENGVCLVFRLCVDHYHRYCYPADGVKGENVFIPGRLHTVRPIALETVPVFAQNAREYTLLSTPRFGEVLQMEVGALLVGKIRNHHGAGAVKKGEEKGMFLYGGSTVILLLEQGRITLDERLLENTKKGVETPVLMGELLGVSPR